tara:strand:+ start:3006 stop:3536 length:531 start_codon:yes stop_codon:yes gene_type:complete
MNLKQIKQRKVRQKLAWLQTELEETKIIYKDCVEKFNTDFRNYLMGNDGPIEPSPKISKDPLDEIESDVDEDTFKQMYRKVAGKTHPDKKDGDENKFKQANEANRNKDFGKLLDMADELGLDVPMDDKMKHEMNQQIKAISDNITKMKSTMAWVWVHIEPDSKENMKQYILQQLNI